MPGVNLFFYFSKDIRYELIQLRFFRFYKYRLCTINLPDHPAAVINPFSLYDISFRMTGFIQIYNKAEFRSDIMKAALGEKQELIRSEITYNLP